MFTICALLYGDHYPLALRLLESLTKLPKAAYQLRLGLNQPCAATMQLVRDLAPLLPLTTEAVYYSPVNAHKYPLMRAMFYARRPIDTLFTQWFDDDSYLLDPPADWLDQVQFAMGSCGMLGSIYVMDFFGAQRTWIASQPWYRGLSVPPRGTFVTGGWWTARTDILQRHDWPIPELDHNGGDGILLGELCRQQGYPVGRFRKHVAINADGNGQESKAPRRGISQRPLGYNYAGQPLPWIPTFCPFCRLTYDSTYRRVCGHRALHRKTGVPGCTACL